MKTFRSLPLVCFLALSLTAAAPAQEEQVKAIAKSFAATEAQLKDISHFEWKATDVNEEFTHHCQAWRNLEGQIVKVSDDLELLTSRELTEYFFSGGKLNFVLQRMEENQDGGGAKVTESRCYIAGGKVIRKQTKSAKFKEGQKRDTADAKAAEAAPGTDDSPEAWQTEALRIAGALQAGPSDYEGEAPAEGHGDPEAEITGAGAAEGPASKVSKVIAESASPDGRYAFAWGLKDDKGARRSEEDADQGSENVVNYLVDTKADAILALTAGKHFGADASYNHWEHKAIWSADSGIVIQTVDIKWETLSAEAFRINDGKATRMADVLAGVKKAVESKLAKSHAKQWKAQGESCTFTISELKVGKDGTLSLTAYHQIPKEEGGFTSQVSGKLGDDGSFTAKDITVTTD